MRHIMVMNAKGGCGKSTIATNLAAYYATEGANVTLADYDPQGSSLDWLSMRPENRAKIHGLPAYEHGLRGLPRNTDIVIMDAPARSHGHELTDLLRRAETVIVPVLASTIDIHASKRFIQELRGTSRVAGHHARLGLVGNRVKENTLAWDDLREFLERERVPYVAALREAQNYVRAYTRGLGIFELPPYIAYRDWEYWEPMLQWLDSVRSRPTA